MEIEVGTVLTMRSLVPSSIYVLRQAGKTVGEVHAAPGQPIEASPVAKPDFLIYGDGRGLRLRACARDGRLRFRYAPRFVLPGGRLIFRDGETYAIRSRVLRALDFHVSIDGMSILEVAAEVDSANNSDARVRARLNRHTAREHETELVVAVCCLALLAFRQARVLGRASM